MASTDAAAKQSFYVRDFTNEDVGIAPREEVSLEALEGLVVSGCTVCAGYSVKRILCVHNKR